MTRFRKRQPPVPEPAPPAPERTRESVGAEQCPSKRDGRVHGPWALCGPGMIGYEKCVACLAAREAAATCRSSRNGQCINWRTTAARCPEGTCAVGDWDDKLLDDKLGVRTESDPCWWLEQ